MLRLLLLIPSWQNIKSVGQLFLFQYVEHNVWKGIMRLLQFIVAGVENSYGTSSSNGSTNNRYVRLAEFLQYIIFN